MQVLVGKIPKRANDLVLEWASMHREELVSNWEKARIQSETDKIEPLK